MKTMRPIRSLTLAAAAALASLAAHAGPPEESWWQRDGDTLGLHVQDQGFCAITTDHSARPTLWIVRGQVIDGRLVEASRRPLGAAPAVSGETASQRIDPPDFFVQPTAMVSRERTIDAPRGSFTLYQPLAQAPSDSLWLSLAWHCDDPAQVDRMAALRAGE